jgi:hypothetical protein
LIAIARPRAPNATVLLISTGRAGENASLSPDERTLNHIQRVYDKTERDHSN